MNLKDFVQYLHQSGIFRNAPADLGCAELGSSAALEQPRSRIELRFAEIRRQIDLRRQVDQLASHRRFLHSCLGRHTADRMLSGIGVTSAQSTADIMAQDPGVAVAGLFLEGFPRAVTPLCAEERIEILVWLDWIIENDPATFEAILARYIEDAEYRTTLMAQPPVRAGGTP
jgi:hypothetical protein